MEKPIPSGTRQEWTAAIELLAEQPVRSGQTVGADKGYDVGTFVSECRELGVTPHVATKNRYSRIDQRTTRHAGYKISQRKRKRVEELFGWMKTYGLCCESCGTGVVTTSAGCSV